MALISSLENPEEVFVLTSGSSSDDRRDPLKDSALQEKSKGVLSAEAEGLAVCHSEIHRRQVVKLRFTQEGSLESAEAFDVPRLPSCVRGGQTREASETGSLDSFFRLDWSWILPDLFAWVCGDGGVNFFCTRQNRVALLSLSAEAGPSLLGARAFSLALTGGSFCKKCKTASSQAAPRPEADAAFSGLFCACSSQLFVGCEGGLFLGVSKEIPASFRVPAVFVKPD